MTDKTATPDREIDLDLASRLNLSRRGFLKTTAVGAMAVGAGGLLKTEEAQAFAYEPYPRDDDLQTVVTSCAHNCGSRHALIAHKKGDVIVRISTDDGRYQKDGFFGKDTEEEPQLRGCLRGRSYRQRLYSAERLLYPMMRVGRLPWNGPGRPRKKGLTSGSAVIVSPIAAISRLTGITRVQRTAMTRNTNGAS